MRWWAALGLVLVLGCDPVRFSFQDASVGDAMVSVACPDPDGDTLALLSFDSDEGTNVLRDVLGNHDGELLRSVAQLVDGPTGCGRALTFIADAVGVIPDAPDWQLERGSIDFWIRRPPGMTEAVGVVSRDETGTGTPGHLTMLLDPSGLLAVRRQGPGGGVVCSDVPIPDDDWAHVGLNFGDEGLALWINGELSVGSGIVAGMNCGSAVGGIAGNTLPWFLGASRVAVNSATNAYSDPFVDGAVDHVRISRIRRDFSNYAAVSM